MQVPNYLGLSALMKYMRLSFTTSLFEPLRKLHCGLVDSYLQMHAIKLCLQTLYALHTLIQPLITYPNLELS